MEKRVIRVQAVDREDNFLSRAHIKVFANNQLLCDAKDTEGFVTVEKLEGSGEISAEAFYGNYQHVGKAAPDADVLSIKFREVKLSGDTHMFERIVAAIVAVAIVGFIMALAWRNVPIDPGIMVLVRIILSLAMAVLGATVPGFLNVSWSGGGLVIRAGGALALFVLTLVYTPTIVRNITAQPSATVQPSIAPTPAAK
jgi:hypothetical protein